MSLELVEYKNCVQPFLIHHSSIRGKLVRLAEVADDILTRHNYPEAVSYLLAELLVIATMLSANLKGKGILTLQLKGEGPVRFMVVDATANGTLRGYADVDEEKISQLEVLKPYNNRLSELMGKGYIAITLDQGKEPYQGIVQLSDESLTETMQHYFTHSEQSEVMLKVMVGRTHESDSGGHWRAGGILLQHIPGEGGSGIAAERISHDPEDTPDAQWHRACLFTNTVKDTELLDQYLPPQQLLYHLYNEDGVWVYDATSVSAGCRCSREKISRTLASFPREEIESLAVDGNVLVNCQFCNKEEVFNEEDVAQLYAIDRFQLD